MGPLPAGAKVIFLHHSTGEVVWGGGVSDWIAAYNRRKGTHYAISEKSFPSGKPYPWDNYPYDYWNIWVNHAGAAAYMGEPTLEMLTREYQVIVWKHCYPVSDTEQDTGKPEVRSSARRPENYRLQYEALKKKMHQFPRTRFIVWTGAARVAGQTEPNQALRSRQFFDWVKRAWDEKGDNIFVWDFWQLETDGSIFLLPQNAQAADDSHPNAEFGARVAPLLGQRIVDVIEGHGDTRSLTGA